MMSSSPTTTAVRQHPISDYQAVLEADGVLVDVRNPEELVTGTLPGAANVPLSEFVAHSAQFEPHQQVVLFCRSGGRSGQAAQFLCDNGFSNVVNLAGGMMAWESAR